MDNLPMSGTVAQLVKQRMEDQAVSIRSVAEQTHIPYVTLTRRLSGQTPFTLTELISVAETLGTKASAFVLEAEAAA